MTKENLSEMRMAKSCYMMLASERIGLRCLAGMEILDGYIDFGAEGPRKSLLAVSSLYSHLVIYLGWVMERPFSGINGQMRC